MQRSVCFALAMSVFGIGQAFAQPMPMSQGYHSQGYYAAPAAVPVAQSYAQPQGSDELRRQVAALHDVDPDWVVITTGASEALSALYCLAAEPGASITLPFPLFPAMPVMARAWGLTVSTYALDRANGFKQSAERVLAAVRESTRLVLRASLGEEAFADAWGEGRALSLDAAVGLALERTGAT